jgi:hypothetical protein
VELRFEGRGLHREQTTLGVLASNYKQIFGRFTGVLRPIGRPAVRIDNLWGFVEDQYVKW